MKYENLFLVLGSNSFTGSNFVNHLINLNHKVVCVSRSSEAKQYLLGYPKKSSKKYFYKLDLNKDHNKLVRLIKKKKTKIYSKFFFPKYGSSKLE